MKPRRRAKTRKIGHWLLVALCAATALLAGLTLSGIRRANERASLDPNNTSGPAALRSKDPSALMKVPDEIPPWKATPVNTPALPPGTVAAWQVNPPPPDPSSPPPPPPHEPPNPALLRPSMD
jgi:hypothetical protein